MTATTFNNLRMFWALTQRDLKVLRTKLSDTMFNNIIFTCLQALIFGFFLPRMGMPLKFIQYLFLGEIILITFTINYNFALKLVFDLRFSRFIDYHLTLPLPKAWLFAHYLASMILENIICTTPPTIGLIALLTFKFATIQPHILPFLLIYSLCLVTFSAFFLALAFISPFKWFLNNTWTRLLAPLTLLGYIWFPVEAIMGVSRPIGYLYFLNPLSYVAESWRTFLLGSTPFIPTWLCVIVIICWMISMLTLVRFGLQKRLDPV